MKYLDKKNFLKNGIERFTLPNFVFFVHFVVKNSLLLFFSSFSCWLSVLVEGGAGQFGDVAFGEEAVEAVVALDVFVDQESVF